jgi:TP901 family phage tail tape measure protein
MADYDLGQYGAEIVLNDKNFTKNMNNAEKQMESFDKEAQGFGASLGTLATGAIAGLGVALVGAGVAGVKMADDLDKALNGLQASTGATDKEMKGMEDSLKNIYNNNFGESFADIAQSMSLVKQNTGLAGKELEQATQNALMLRDTFEMDVTETTNTANSLMKQFGISSKDAFNLIAQGAQNGANKNGDLLDSLNEYAPQFKSMGFSAEEFTNVLIDGAKNGVFSIDKVGDAIKEFNIRAKDGSKTTIDAFRSLGLNADQMGSSFAQGGEKGREAFQHVMTALNNVKDPMEKNRIGVQLFGTQFEDIEAKGIAAFANIGDSASLSKDALEQINQVKYDSFGEALTGIGRNLQTGLLMPIGEKLLPVLNNFASWISSNIPAIQEFFKNTFSGIGTVIDNIVSKFQGSGETFEQYKTMFIGAFNTIKEVVIPLIETIGQQVMGVVNLIADWWKTNGSDMLTNVQTIFNGMWSVIQFVMPAIQLIVETVFDAVKNVINGALNVIGGVLKVFAGLFTGDWSKLWDGVKQTLSGAVELIWGIINLNFFKSILSGMKTLWTKGIEAIKGMWTGISKLFDDAVRKVGTSVSGLVKGVLDWFTKMWNQAQTIFSMLRQFGENIFSAMKNTIISVASNIWSQVVSKFTALKDGAVGIFNSLKSKASEIFGGIKSAMQNPISAAKDFIKEQIDKIVGFFKGMKIEFPKIKLPHFSLKGEFSLKKMTVPSVGVDWYKNGGFFNKPTMIGVGEAGKEAVVPLVGSQMDPFADAVYRRLAQKMNHGGSSVTNSNQTINFSPVVNFDVKGGLTRKDMDQAANYMFGTISNHLKSLGVKPRL